MLYMSKERLMELIQKFAEQSSFYVCETTIHYWHVEEAIEQYIKQWRQVEVTKVMGNTNV